MKTEKCIMLGASGVGKSSIIQQLVKNEFTPDSMVTTYASCVQTQLNVDGVLIPLSIWDTAGQEKYVTLAPMYFRGTKLVAIVFDSTSSISFDRAKFWRDEIGQKALNSPSLMLLANKSDLEPEFDLKIAAEYAAQNNMLYFEVSAKTGKNVRQAFEQLAAILVDAKAGQLVTDADAPQKIFASDHKTKGCC